MKVWVIGHPEAVEGFALVGVQGVVAETAEAINKAFDEVLLRSDLGVVLVTDYSANSVRERFDQLRLMIDPPIFLEIPGPDGPDPERMTLTEIAEQAIGIHR